MLKLCIQNRHTCIHGIYVNCIIICIKNIHGISKTGTVQPWLSGHLGLQGWCWYIGQVKYIIVSLDNRSGSFFIVLKTILVWDDHSQQHSFIQAHAQVCQFWSRWVLSSALINCCPPSQVHRPRPLCKCISAVAEIENVQIIKVLEERGLDDRGCTAQPVS